jgi:hypothetical protein
MQRQLPLGRGVPAASFTAASMPMAETFRGERRKAKQQLGYGNDRY